MSLITVIHIYLKIECIKNRKKLIVEKILTIRIFTICQKKKKNLYKNCFISSSFFKKKKTIVPKYEIRYKFLYFFSNYMFYSFSKYMFYRVFQFSLYIPLKNNLFTFIIIFLNICFLGTRFSNYS